MAFPNVTDGTSHTVMMSEIRKGSNGAVTDWRGLYLPDGNAYTHTLGPNSSTADTVRGRTCPAGPVAPCIDGAWQRWPRSSMDLILAARSYHPRGVHALRVDGSLHFVDETIELGVWQAAATPDGGEVVEGF